jgi:hypothetical protein
VSGTDDIYAKARDVVADVLDGMGFIDDSYNAADRLIGKLDTAGYMVWPKREDWKRLDELEAERVQLLAVVVVARQIRDFIRGDQLIGGEECEALVEFLVAKVDDLDGTKPATDE